jgi:hypothetical protein
MVEDINGVNHTKELDIEIIIPLIYHNNLDMKNTSAILQNFEKYST